MRRVVFCIVLAFVAGTGLATVLSLGIASFTAAAYKSKAGLETPIYDQMHRLQPTIIASIIVGFTIGAAVMVWLFYRTDQSQPKSVEEGSDDQSEV